MYFNARTKRDITHVDSLGGVHGIGCLGARAARPLVQARFTLPGLWYHPGVWRYE